MSGMSAIETHHHVEEGMPQDPCHDLGAMFATRSKGHARTLLGAPGRTTRSKDATRSTSDLCDSLGPIRVVTD